MAGDLMGSLAEDLIKLRTFKDDAEAEGREKKEADAEFKKWQAKCLERMEIEKCESFRTSGYLYSKVEKVKGQIEDRRLYVRWALENDPAIREFLDEWGHVGVDDIEARFEAAFYDAITGTSMVHYKEDGNVINQQARSHVDDAAPLPPGLTFRPDPYMSMTKS